ncbi:MAG: chromosome segregation protein SMC [Pseudomonadota bacterium]
MRLNKIKLAGFKSFVDPTSIVLPSNLVGVVGPNGCGKSNTIDAVRWVMGESSAKHLRGDSMDDVIFSGSRARQPVGQASVELIFDNSDGAVGGEYASYAEISVKRQVTRDGQSNYYLNGSRCRRRDITDIFLGTGLGPRSYAIIEQGMISRLIEAKPEELRVYIEEAAGISKYKDRRRETENRIRHTRDNLDRLNDLREEVEKQISHLKRQARTAERFKTLKAQERQLKAELLALRKRELASALELKEKRLQERETELEKCVADQRAAESAIEKLREKHVEANDQFNSVQGDYYKLGADVSRAEQTIQHNRDTRQRQQSELNDLEHSWAEINQHISQDQEKIRELTEAISGDTPDYERLIGEQKDAAAVLAKAEQAMSDWQSQWDDYNRRNAEPLQSAQIERSRIEQFDQHMQQVKKRNEAKKLALQTMGDGDLGTQIEALIREEADAQGAEAQCKTQLAQQADSVAKTRQKLDETQQSLTQLREGFHTEQGRLASLEALQQAAMGEQDGDASRWLSDHGLDGNARLATQITVEPGWELAAETVLDGYLEGVCVDNMPDSLDALNEGRLTLLSANESSNQAAGGNDWLRGRLKSSHPLPSIVDGVRVTSSYTDALAMRAQLGAGESIVTADGVWVGPNWIRVNRGHSQESSVLAREQEIKKLRESLQAQTSQIEELDKKSQALKGDLHASEQQRDVAQGALSAAHRKVVETQSRLSGLRVRQEQNEQNRNRTHEEIVELDRQFEEYQNQARESTERRSRALELVDQLAKEGDALTASRSSLREQLDVARGQSQQSNTQGQEIAVRVESMRSACEAAKQNLARMESQLGALKQRRDSLTQAMAESEAPIKREQENLESLLANRITVERSLGEARKQVETIESSLREQEQNRVRGEQAATKVRSILEQERLASQEERVRIKTLEEQIAESGFAFDQLMAEMPEQANAQLWAENVEAMEARINRLGPINLAAIDEHAEQEQRKAYLDKQFEDVTEALTTLEAAIEKIDRETRARFKETFEKVNVKLQSYFPRLFGGGHANLIMTGNDLLSTGVSVLARPPGKRVSNIHLLSGGEKALTAVALVFAFFELNPAPFCMLDEVDAPLDDANVGRYCELVREMSERVQFIFITHNKVTMELSDHLMGVTMHEPGVSRLVSVDIAEAAQMVEAV